MIPKTCDRSFIHSAIAFAVCGILILSSNNHRAFAQLQAPDQRRALLSADEQPVISDNGINVEQQIIQDIPEDAEALLLSEFDKRYNEDSLADFKVKEGTFQGDIDIMPDMDQLHPGKAKKSALLSPEDSMNLAGKESGKSVLQSLVHEASLGSILRPGFEFVPEDKKSSESSTQAMETKKELEGGAAIEEVLATSPPGFDFEKVEATYPPISESPGDINLSTNAPITDNLASFREDNEISSTHFPEELTIREMLATYPPVDEAPAREIFTTSPPVQTFVAADAEIDQNAEALGLMEFDMPSEHNGANENPSNNGLFIVSEATSSEPVSDTSNEEVIPSDWQLVTVPETGTSYYWNAISNEVWQKVTDPSSGNQYYWSPITNESTWRVPESLKGFLEQEEEAKREAEGIPEEMLLGKYFMTFAEKLKSSAETEPMNLENVDVSSMDNLFADPSTVFETTEIEWTTLPFGEEAQPSQISSPDQDEKMAEFDKRKVQIDQAQDMNADIVTEAEEGAPSWGDLWGARGEKQEEEDEKETPSSKTVQAAPKNSFFSRMMVWFASKLGFVKTQPTTAELISTKIFQEETEKMTQEKMRSKILRRGALLNTLFPVFATMSGMFTLVVLAFLSQQRKHCKIYMCDWSSGEKGDDEEEEEEGSVASRFADADSYGTL